LSGVILGPPNHHDYQNQLRKLHAERFSRMPFDVFKSRVKIVKDEAVVKKWVEEQSFKTEYTVLNVPEPLKLPSIEEVEKHFRAVHKDTIIKSVESHSVAGVPSRSLRSRELQSLVRNDWERQGYFPIQLATKLSQMFAGHGLQFFKVNKTVTHVGVARPQFLDLETTPVSESIKSIIGFINTNPKCTRRKMIEALAPSPSVIEVKPAEQKSAEPTPEQNALIADLHWLIHQGHVIEFANGVLETAKRPLPKPEPKRPAAPAQAAAPSAAAAVGEAAAPEPAVEAAPVTTADTPQPETPVAVEQVFTAGNEAPELETPPSEPPPAVSGESPVEPSAAPVVSPS
jgi:hypothetical protein